MKGKDARASSGTWEILHGMKGSGDGRGRESWHLKKERPPMGLGVLNNLSAIYAENNLNNTNNSLQTVLQQLSSGSRINSGADDAAGLSLVNGLAANSAALTQSGTNATEGVGLLDVADGALSQVTNLLNRAITLATEASNGTLNTTQSAAANQEYQSILSEVNNIGSTTTYNQVQVFAGNTVGIYTGDSSTEGSSIDDITIRALSSANVGDTDGQISYSNGANNLFIDLSKDGTNAGVTDSLSGLTTTVNVSYLTKGAGGSAITATAPISVGAGTTYANTVQGLITAINNAGLGLSAAFTTATQAGTGAVQAAGDSDTATAGTGIDTGIEISGTGLGTGSNGAGVVGALTVSAAGDLLGGTLTIVGSDGKSDAVALGTVNSTDTIANLAATINSDGFGVTAAVVGTTLTLTSANSAVTVAGASLTDAGAATTLSSIPIVGAPYYAQVGTFTVAANTDPVFGTLTIGQNTITLGAPGSTANIAQLATYINSDKFGVTAALNSAGTVITFSSANSAMTFAGTPFDAGAPDPVVTTANAAFSEYYSVGISGTVTDGSTGGGTTVTGLASDTNGSGGIATTSYSDGVGENLSSTDLSTQANAEVALNDLNVAISDAAALDGYIGGQINTLNSVSQVLSTQQENVVSAQNAVQATDYASATSNLSKYEVLSQTGISALAQANSIQQEVTKLLQ
jgi:flagellin